MIELHESVIIGPQGPVMCFTIDSLRWFYVLLHLSAYALRSNLQDTLDTCARNGGKRYV